MVRVEFYGVPRLRAGVAQVDVFCVDSLGDLLGKLVEQFPALAQDCITNGRLGDSCTANLDGHRFVRDPSTPLTGVQTVLILSADAGG